MIICKLNWTGLLNYGDFLFYKLCIFSRTYTYQTTGVRHSATNPFWKIVFFDEISKGRCSWQIIENKHKYIYIYIYIYTYIIFVCFKEVSKKGSKSVMVDPPPSFFVWWWWTRQWTVNPSPSSHTNLSPSSQTSSPSFRRRALLVLHVVQWNRRKSHCTVCTIEGTQTIPRLCTVHERQMCVIQVCYSVSRV